MIEIEMMKHFDHPNLPKIIDVIEAGDSLVMIMDYIEGAALSNLLNNGAQPEKTVIEWAKQLCDVLHYLHTHNPPIIYRDLKPANIMLRPDGRIILIDFGTARQQKEQNVADTVCLGTVGYAAPEQFGGMGQTDARTDIYNLGVTLYHLVTGRNPAEPPYEIFPIRKINPQLTYGLEFIIDKCVRRNPDARYQSAAEVKNDLDNIKKLDAKYRRKGIVKASINKIFEKKPKQQKKSGFAPQFAVPGQVGNQPVIPYIVPGQEEKPSPGRYTVPVPAASFAEPADVTTILPVCGDVNPSQVVKKSSVVNSNTVVLCDKVAVCVSTRSKACVGDQVNVYFATEASKSDIVKLIYSSQGYTKVVTGDRIIDINHDDLVKIRLNSEDLVFSINEFEFIWKDCMNQKFYEYFSFQIRDILKSERACLTVQLYVNGENCLEIPAAYM